jgi:hypothetical protein
MLLILYKGQVYLDEAIEIFDGIAVRMIFDGQAATLSEVKTSNGEN